MATELLGIFQADIIIRSTIVAAIKDIRKNPYLLDHIFTSLAYDDLTKATYGQKAIDAAKTWFINTDIPVFMNTRLDEAKFPCISIALLESNEEQNTLADIHHDPFEDLDSTDEQTWEVLIGPFNPISYDAVTGLMVIPAGINGDTVITAGLVVVDKNGNVYDIIDSCDESSFTIDPILADFSDATIRIKRPTKLIAVESALFKESYAIGCHSQNESIYLTYLHSIVVFILLRYREELLEARGFERTFITSGDFSRNEFTDTQITYSRFIKITGYVRQYWPKLIGDTLVSFIASLAMVRAVNDSDSD